VGLSGRELVVGGHCYWLAQRLTASGTYTIFAEIV